jgi:hypothetical protein
VFYMGIHENFVCFLITISKFAYSYNSLIWLFLKELLPFFTVLKVDRMCVWWRGVFVFVSKGFYNQLLHIVIVMYIKQISW